MEQAAELDRKHGETLRGEFCVPTMRSMGLGSPGKHPEGPGLEGGPEVEDPEVVYLCGNSLGLMPGRTRQAVNRELDAWAMRGVESHFRHPGEAGGCASWVEVDLPLAPLLAPVVGAERGEVAVMNSLTANLNSMLVAFYRPAGGRTQILFEKGAFPSDYYAFYAQCELHGLDPKDTLVQLEPRAGETHLRTQDVLDTIERLRGSLALVCLPGVQYYSGQLFEMEAITRFAHRFPGIVVGWDLAHAVGNVELRLHEWGVDFACWCSYKYLNAGPGAIGGLFVHAKHAGGAAEGGTAGVSAGDSAEGGSAGGSVSGGAEGAVGGNEGGNALGGNDATATTTGPGATAGANSASANNGTASGATVAAGAYLPRLAGWWGNNAARRFQMLEHFEPIPGALGFRQSNPSVLDVVALRSSLELFAQYGGMRKLRARSLQLTGYLLRLLQESPFYTDDHSRVGFSVITPVARAADHGAQLSLRFYPLDSDTMERVSRYANQRGLIGDERRPNVMRLAPAPLYNTFRDVFRATELLNEALAVVASG